MARVIRQGNIGRFLFRFSELNRTQYFAVALLLILFCVGYGYFCGQDLNYDQLNYHLFAASDFLNGGHLADFALAQRQSWFNPLPSLLPYSVITRFSPLAAQVLLSLLSVPSFLMAYILIRRLLRFGAEPRDLILALSALFIGMTSYVSFLVTGTTLSEAWFPVLVLGALFLLLPGEGPISVGRCAAAGLLLGLAAGFKFTNAPFAVGGGVAILVLLWRRRIALLQVAVYVLAASAGAFAAGGWWQLRLWNTYGDPFYPLFATALHSPWATSTPLPAESFRPTHAWQLVSDPLALAIGQHDWVISTSLPVRDARPLVLVLSLIVLAVAYVVRLARGRPVSDSRLVAVAMMLPAYLLWFAVFNIERYMAPGYLMAGAFTVLAVFELVPSGQRLPSGIAAAIMGLVLVTSHPIRSGRAPLGKDWFGLNVPAGVARPDTLYVMSGFGPMAWLALRSEMLGPRARLIRVGGNFPIEPESRMGARMADAIRSNAGPIRSLEMIGHDLLPADRFGPFGLAKTGDCAVLTSKAGNIESCVLARVRSSSAK